MNKFININYGEDVCITILRDDVILRCSNITMPPRTDEEKENLKEEFICYAYSKYEEFEPLAHEIEEEEYKRLFSEIFGFGL